MVVVVVVVLLRLPVLALRCLLRGGGLPRGRGERGLSVMPAECPSTSRSWVGDPACEAGEVHSAVEKEETSLWSLCARGPMAGVTPGNEAPRARGGGNRASGVPGLRAAAGELLPLPLPLRADDGDSDGNRSSPSA